MKTNNSIFPKFLWIFFSLFVVTFSGYAQDYEAEEEVTYEPIHTTILPTSLNIEENYNKNFSVGLEGDELVLRIKKLDFKDLAKGSNVLEKMPKASFKLPIDPRKDFVIELDFTCPKFKNDCITIFLNSYFIQLIKKMFILQNIVTHEIINSPKKWSLPVGSNKDKVNIKIEKRNKILTIFANSVFLGEFKDAKNLFKETELSIGLTGGKGSTLILNSIKVDQGPISDD